MSAPQIDPAQPTWYLLGPRPGWRIDTVLSSGLSFDADAIALEPVTAPPPEPSERCLLDPRGDLVLLDPAATDPAKRVVVAAANRQVLGYLDPGAAWAPDGLVVVGRIYVRDRTAGVVHEFDRCRRHINVHLGTAIPASSGPTVGHAATGTFVSLPLDSGLNECVWHRVALRGRVPIGAHVAVDTLTANVDLPTAALVALPDDRWTTAGMWGDPTLDQWDALVGSEPGRFLWLRATLVGDGTVTPRLDDIEVHFPRLTSRGFLPAAYQRTADRGSFVERYLAITDRVRDSLVDQIDVQAWWFDPAATPNEDPDLLSWLTGWMGLELSEGLPAARRRCLLAEAADLYRWRGTPRGIERHASLWLGRRAIVIERYRHRRWSVLGHGRLGDATELFGADIVRRLQLDEHATIGQFALIEVGEPRLDPFNVEAHRFTLFVHTCDGDDVELLADRAAQLLDVIKPAHTAAAVAVVDAHLTVGRQATLGVDAVVAGAPRPEPLGLGRLGETAAVAAEPWRRGRAALGYDARIGSAVVA